MRSRYLERIGFTEDEAAALVARPPNLADISTILVRQAEAVAFENLDQRDHPAGDGCPAVARQAVPATLAIRDTLDKLVTRRRGGFCFEVNHALAWLLRALGYSARLALSDIRCRGTLPFTHVVVIVDGSCLTPAAAGPERDYVCDLGIGEPFRVAVPLFRR